MYTYPRAKLTRFPPGFVSRAQLHSPTLDRGCFDRPTIIRCSIGITNWSAALRVGQLILLAFLIVPIFEIYLLITVGGWIGVLPTIGLIVLTAVLGSLLLRHQGLATLREAQRSMAQGAVPAKSLLDAVFLAVGGVLLLTPGFFTDAIGFACLLPAGRAWLVKLALRRAGLVSASAAAGPVMDNPATGAQSGRGRPTIEGEWRREDD
jgi:UPF0716 protein FxsA